MSSPQDNGRTRVEGWKEIAAFFGRGVRTVQAWESEGLRVYRFQNRVWAYTDEMQQFLDSRSIGPGEQEVDRAQDDAPISAPSEGAQSMPGRAPVQAVETPGTPVAHSSSRRRRFAQIGLIIAIILIFAAGRWSARLEIGTREIARADVSAQTLRAYDDSGRSIWSYRLHETPIVERTRPPDLADIDGDGHPELLYTYAIRSGTELYCFRSDGKLAWRTPLGREIETVYGKLIYPQYWTTQVAVLKKPRADGGRIIALSHHSFSWAAEVAVLTNSGRIVAEYWHPGWLTSMEIADLDGDGVEDILLGGSNNSLFAGQYGATLVVLDSRFRTGEGVVKQGDTRQIKGLDACDEKAVLLFPEITPGDRPPEDGFGSIDAIEVLDNALNVRLQNGRPEAQVHYQLDRALAVRSVTASPWLLEHIGAKSSAEYTSTVWQRFGNVRVIKNRLVRR